MATAAASPPKLTVSNDAVTIAINKCTSLQKTITETLISPSKISDTSKRTLLRLVAAELRFLSRLSSLDSPDSSSLRSSNIGYLESIVRILQTPSISKVSRVCKPVGGSVHVDVVCTIGRHSAWILVSDRNPNYLSWLSSSRNKGVKVRVEEVLVAARSAGSLKPDSVLLFFCSGVGEDVKEKLRVEFGASEIGIEEFGFGDCGFDDLEDGWVNVKLRTPRVFEVQVELKDVDCPDDSVTGFDSGVRSAVCERSEDGSSSGSDDLFLNLMSGMRERSDDGDLVGYGAINFDTTALIALVSGISNGGTKQLHDAPEVDLKKRFKGNYEFVMAQVQSELNDPILVELKAVVAGKKGIICESVYQEFMGLISMCGGPNEKYRAKQLLNCLKIVPDNLSARMLALPTTRKIAKKNKIVFGTGDYWRAPTLTANVGFVRAISQTGMSLLTIEHRPRALTGD